MGLKRFSSIYFYSFFIKTVQHKYFLSLPKKIPVYLTMNPCQGVIVNGPRKGNLCARNGKNIIFNCTDGNIKKPVCSRHKNKCYELIQDKQLTMKGLNDELFTQPNKVSNDKDIELMSIESSPSESPIRDIEIVDTPKSEKETYVYYPKNSNYMHTDKNGDLHINIKQLWSQKHAGQKDDGKSEVKSYKKPVAKKPVDTIEVIDDSDSDDEYYGDDGSVVDINDFDGPTIIDSETGELREMTEKEIDEMERLIQRYYRQFPQLQVELPPESRGSLDCNEWLKEIRIFVASINSNAVLKDGFNATVSFLGHLCNCEPYFSESIDPYKNEAIEAQLKECELEIVPFLAEFSPSQRLMLSVGSALLMAIKHKHALEQSPSNQIKQSNIL